jgi:hypothetical protein
MAKKKIKRSALKPAEIENAIFAVRGHRVMVDALRLP